MKTTAVALASMALALTCCASAPSSESNSGIELADRGPASQVALGQTQVLLAASKRRFMQLFTQTSGFGNVSEFEASLKQSPESLELLSQIRNGKFADVAMYRHEEIRDKIAQNGFLNLYQVHESGGTIDNEKLRSTAEANLLGLTFNDYRKVPSSLKPKSTLLQPTIDSNFSRPIATSMLYGEDAYIFKPSSVNQRCTWTPQDSLDRYIEGNGVTTLAVHPENVDLNDPTVTAETRAEMKYLGKPAAAWDQLFIPCENFSLLIPFVLPYLSANHWMQSSGVPYLITGEEKVRSNLLSEVPAHQLKTSLKWQTQLASYIEVQLWGTLNLDDVQAFQFSKSPPSGNFLEQLLKRKIEIRDARNLTGSADESFTNAHPTIWKPGSN